MTSERNSQ